MNVKEYISSGIIESYVLGIATPAERQDFEAMCRQYAEIAAARDAFEASLEMQLISDAPTAPVFLRQKIQDSLADVTSTPQSAAVKEETTPVRRMAVWKMVAAASLVIAAGALIWAISANGKLRDLEADNTVLKNRLAQSSAELDGIRTETELLYKPHIKMAALKGTPKAPASYATVYWDTTSKDVYLMINNLPEPASGNQYQLWALLDGKPVDLGIFDMTIRRRLLVKMQNVSNAQAFAITLEPKGGSPSPTMDAMMVLGEL